MTDHWAKAVEAAQDAANADAHNPFISLRQCEYALRAALPELLEAVIDKALSSHTVAYGLNERGEEREIFLPGILTPGTARDAAEKISRGEQSLS
jgi:hypothetical protein